MTHQPFESFNQTDQTGLAQEFQAMFELNAVGMAQADPASGRFVRVNRKLCALSGYTEAELLGMTYSQLTHPDDRGLDTARFQAALRAETDGWTSEKRYIRKDGQIIWVEVTGTLLRDASGRPYRSLGVIQDITARKQAEERTHFLADVIEHASQPFGVGRLDGRLDTFNPAYCHLVGYSPEEMQAIDWATELTPSEWREVEAERLAELRRTGQPVRYEKEYIRKDGTRVPVELLVHLGRDEAGTPQYYYSFITDITARKQAEEELRRLNRTLRARTRNDQALRRVTTEEQYLADVCRIVIEDCGHAMVWIGFAEEDEAKTVRPAACAGFEEGYLETLHITWADTERGRGPTGTAIRTQKPSLCRNMLTDPQFAPWRDEALRRGYASSAVLPLRANGQAFGAINIYSTQPDSFSPDEVDLLLGLADDVAYGLGMIRLSVAHAQAEQDLQESNELARVRALEIASLARFPAENPSPVLRLSQAGVILYANEASRMLLDRWGSQVNSLASAYWRSLIADSFANLTIRTVEVGLDQRVFSFVVVPVAEGDYVNLYGRDITERQAAEQALEQANAELQFQNEELQTQAEELEALAEELLQLRNVVPVPLDLLGHQPVHTDKNDLHDCFFLFIC